MTTEGDAKLDPPPRRRQAPSVDEARVAYLHGVDEKLSQEIEDARAYLRQLRKRKVAIFAAELVVVGVVVIALVAGIYLLVRSGPAAGGLSAGLGALLSSVYFALGRIRKNVDRDENKVQQRLTERIRVLEVLRLTAISENKQNREDMLTDIAAAVTGLVSRDAEVSSGSIENTEPAPGDSEREVDTQDNT